MIQIKSCSKTRCSKAFEWLNCAKISPVSKENACSNAQKEENAMSQDSLKAAVQALRTEIEQLGAGQDTHRARLQSLLSNLEKELAGEPQADLQQGVGHLLEQFEAEHPCLTEVLNRTSVLLSNMGI